MNKEFDLFLFMGQSNMAGRGVTCPAWPQKAPAVLDDAGWEFRAVSDPKQLYPIIEPFGVYENNLSGIYEPGMKTGSLVPSFINACYAQTKVPIVGISASKGGSSIKEWQPGTPYLNDTLERLVKAEVFLAAERKNIRHRFVLWCQGETDGTEKTLSQEYKEYFCRMLKELRIHRIEHCFLIKIGYFNQNAEPESLYQDYEPIRQAQEEISCECDDVTIVSRKFSFMREQGLMKDVYHYYQQGYNLVGEEAGFNVGRWVNGYQA